MSTTQEVPRHLLLTPDEIETLMQALDDYAASSSMKEVMTEALRSGMSAAAAGRMEDPEAARAEAQKVIRRAEEKSRARRDSTIFLKAKLLGIRNFNLEHPQS